MPGSGAPANMDTYIEIPDCMDDSVHQGRVYEAGEVCWSVHRGWLRTEIAVQFLMNVEQRRLPECQPFPGLWLVKMCLLCSRGGKQLL